MSAAISMANKMSNAQLNQQLETFTTRFEAEIKSITETTNSAKAELVEKIDGITARLDTYDEKFAKLEGSLQHTDNPVGELTAQVENGDLIVRQKN